MKNTLLNSLDELDSLIFPMEERQGQVSSRSNSSDDRINSTKTVSRKDSLPKKGIHTKSLRVRLPATFRRLKRKARRSSDSYQNIPKKTSNCSIKSSNSKYHRAQGPSLERRVSQTILRSSEVHASNCTTVVKKSATSTEDILHDLLTTKLKKISEDNSPLVNDDGNDSIFSNLTSQTGSESGNDSRDSFSCTPIGSVVELHHLSNNDSQDNISLSFCSEQTHSSDDQHTKHASALLSKASSTFRKFVPSLLDEESTKRVGDEDFDSPTVSFDQLHDDEWTSFGATSFFGKSYSPEKFIRKKVRFAVSPSSVLAF